MRWTDGLELRSSEPQHTLWTMRSASVTCGVVLASIIAVGAAERAWKPGLWSERTATGAYVIETRTDIITAEATTSIDPITATPGTPVQFAIERQTVYVLASDKQEHTLALRDTVAKYSKSYSAIGGGHYIKAVAPGGTQVTLEDGSRWDIDPRQHFAVAGWQPDDLIAIRREEGDPDYSFEIDNTTHDDGSLANYRVR
jgi:hypothetical protein